MNQTAKYYCPVRGLVDLSAPDPKTLGRTSRTASALGIDYLFLPVLEEALDCPTRRLIQFLDQFIQALDAAHEGKARVILNPLAQQVLDLDWIAKDMVRPPSWAGQKQVFVQGKVRVLQPLNWWVDPSLISRRIQTLREFVGAVAGHPAIHGWSVLDHAPDWIRPEPKAADLVLRTFISEIRTRDEQSLISLDLGWQELVRPGLVAALCAEVDLLRLDAPVEASVFGKNAGPAPLGLAGEMLLAAYLAAMAKWIWKRPIEPLVGRLADQAEPGDEILQAAGVLAGQVGSPENLGGLCWFSLVDPSPEKAEEPPWSLFPKHCRTGLLDLGGEPKNITEPLVKALDEGSGPLINDNFIDLSPDEYRNDPATHLPRLWNHFRECL